MDEPRNEQLLTNESLVVRPWANRPAHTASLSRDLSLIKLIHALQDEVCDEPEGQFPCDFAPLCLHPLLHWRGAVTWPLHTESDPPIR